MDKEDLLQELQECKEQSELSVSDADAAHWRADQALLRFINDRKVTEAFMAIRRFYV